MTIIYRSRILRWTYRLLHIDGITIGRTVRIRYAKDEPEAFGVLAHECVHVQQYARYGFVGFSLRYLWYSLRYGYERNPLEVEARDVSGY